MFELRGIDSTFSSFLFDKMLFYYKTVSRFFFICSSKSVVDQKKSYFLHMSLTIKPYEVS